MSVTAKQMTMSQVKADASSIFLAKVFNWMALGLGTTGIIAYFTFSTGLAITIASSALIYILFIGELGLVLFLTARIHKMQAGTASSMFMLYSVLNGLTLSVIFLRYTGSSIAATFFITAGMFGAMAIYGLVTKRDLSGFGSFLFMGVIGIVIASVVNIFLNSPVLYWTISMIGVLVFTGLTAYDVQKIKKMGEDGIMQQGEAAITKGSIMGALALYLDFINLFLMLLRFFGGGRD